MFMCGPGYLSRYSYSLRAGWSGDRIPVGARISTHVQTRPASYTTGTGSFSRVKRPECGVDHPPPTSAELKETVELLPLWAFVVCSRVNFTSLYVLCGRKRRRSWLRHCATSRKVAGSIPDGVTGIFHWHIPSDRTMAFGSTQPLREKSTKNIYWGGQGGRTLPRSCAECLKIWEPEPAGTLRACPGL